MASVPRIVTVDPTGNAQQQIDAISNLLDRYVRNIPVLFPDDALEEVERGGVDAVIGAWRQADGVQGWELAAKVKETDPNVQVVLLGDFDDPDLSEEMLEQTTYVYLRQPYDVPQFVSVMQAVMTGSDIFAAAQASPQVSSAPLLDYGPVPKMNAERADNVLSTLMQDLQSLAIILATREGEVLLEHGTLGYLDRDEIVNKMLPAMMATVDLRDIIGGNASSMQYFDGDETDIYLISVGLHHFLAIVYDGQIGARQLGAVSRYGRRAAEDIIGVLGAEAWFIQQPQMREPEPEPVERVRKSQARPVASQEEPFEVARAKFDETQDIPDMSAPEEAEPALQLEPISDLDVDALFGGEGDMDDMDDLFSLEAMEEAAKEADSGGKGLVGWDQAQQLGLVESD